MMTRAYCPINFSDDLILRSEIAERVKRYIKFCEMS